MEQYTYSAEIPVLSNFKRYNIGKRILLARFLIELAHHKYGPNPKLNMRKEFAAHEPLKYFAPLDRELIQALPITSLPALPERLTRFLERYIKGEGEYKVRFLSPIMVLVTTYSEPPERFIPNRLITASGDPIVRQGPII